MWHVSSRSSVAILRTAIHLLLSSYNASPDLLIEWTAFNNITKITFTKRGFFLVQNTSKLFSFSVRTLPGTPLVKVRHSPRSTSRLIYYFASAAVAVDSSHMTASSSASWRRLCPPSDVVNGHVSTMWFMVCRWPQSQSLSTKKGIRSRCLDVLPSFVTMVTWQCWNFDIDGHGMSQIMLLCCIVRRWQH